MVEISSANEHRDGVVGGVGVLAALAAELTPLADHASAEIVTRGLVLRTGRVGSVPIVLAVSGVGKVQAARAATLLIEAGATRALLIVGTCGGLSRRLAIGELVLAERAVQVDLAVREGRQQWADGAWTEAWSAALGGAARCPFLTADRPVLSRLRRWRTARDFDGRGVVDMETAAAAAVAACSGVPWAALRAVSDTAGFAPAGGFHANFARQAPRAAASILPFLAGPFSAGPLMAGPPLAGAAPAARERGPGGPPGAILPGGGAVPIEGNDPTHDLPM